MSLIFPERIHNVGPSLRDGPTRERVLVMAIEVHCPNPACARIHKVKNRYSGMRGQCPDCKSWMYVPAGDRVPTSASRATLSDEPIVSAAPMQAIIVEDDEPPLDAPVPRRSRAKKSKPVEADEVSAKSEDEKPVVRRRFSWIGTTCLFLGILGLGAIASSPYLAPATINATEGFATTIGKQKVSRIDADFGDYTSIIPGVAAGVMLLFFVGGLVTRRQGFLTLSFLYLATMFSSAALFLFLPQYKDEARHTERFDATVAKSKLNGMAGDATLVPSQQFYAAIGGAAGACVFFLLAALFIHRRWVSRIFTFLILGLVIAVAPVSNYRVELGLGDIVPEITLQEVMNLFEKIGY